MNSYSPNMLKTFQSCPQKYYYRYIINLNVPQKSSMFEKGKKIHALANYYLRGDNISKLETELNEDEKLVWKKLFNNKYFQKLYVNSEYNLSCKIDKYWIGGRLDAIVRDEKNLYILDYKTGSIPKNPEYDYQTMVYLLCLESFVKSANLNIPIHFVYIDLKNDSNLVITLDDEKSAIYKDEIVKICSSIEKFKFTDTFTQSKSCDFCEYKKFCK